MFQNKTLDPDEIPTPDCRPSSIYFNPNTGKHAELWIGGVYECTGVQEGCRILGGIPEITRPSLLGELEVFWGLNRFLVD
jgi:hypothetical protein